MGRLSADAERFVAEVAHRLRHPDERLRQDQLDVLLMGGSVSEPIRYPNPDCRDCWGEGYVCSCHGFAWSYSNGRGSGCYSDKKREKCSCWRALAPASKEPESAAHSAYPEGSADQ